MSIARTMAIIFCCIVQPTYSAIPAAWRPITLAAYLAPWKESTLTTLAMRYRASGLTEARKTAAALLNSHIMEHNTRDWHAFGALLVACKTTSFDAEACFKRCLTPSPPLEPMLRVDHTGWQATEWQAWFTNYLHNARQLGWDYAWIKENLEREFEMIDRAKREFITEALTELERHDADILRDTR